jgi:hypothetical protein
MDRGLTWSASCWCLADICMYTNGCGLLPSLSGEHALCDHTCGAALNLKAHPTLLLQVMGHGVSTTLVTWHTAGARSD